MDLQASAIAGFARALLVRLPLAYLGSLALLYCMSTPISAVYFPVMEAELTQMVPGCVTTSATLRDGQIKLAFQIRDLPAPAPNPARIRTSTPFGQLLVPPVIALTLLFAWPKMHPRRRVATAFWLVVFLLLTQAFDQPVVVADAVMKTLDNDGGSGRVVWRFWTFMLDNGGRQFLGILAFGLAVAVQRRRERGTSSAIHATSPA